MKYSLPTALVFCWVLVNVGALVGIGSNYSSAWKVDSRIPNVETTTQVSQTATHDQLSKLFVEQDAALRGEMASFYAILEFWLEVTVLNIGIVVGYLWFDRKR